MRIAPTGFSCIGVDVSNKFLEFGNFLGDKSDTIYEVVGSECKNIDALVDSFLDGEEGFG